MAAIQSFIELIASARRASATSNEKKRSTLLCEPSFEVLVIDDGSPEEESKILEQIPNLRLMRNERNLGFLHSCNRGQLEARGEELLFLNNDTLVTNGWIDALVRTRKAFPNAGLIGSCLLFPTGKLQEAGGVIFSDGTAMNYGYGQDPKEPEYTFARKADYVSGASMMISVALFRELAGFDPKFAPAYYEDADLALRIRQAGKDVVYQPASRVIHFGGVTHGRDLESPLKRSQVRNQDIFVERWKETLAAYTDSKARSESAAFRLNSPRALVIEPTMITPDRDAGSLRMFNLMQILRKLGHMVTFIPLDMTGNEIYREQLERNGIHVVCAPHFSSYSEYLEQFGAQFEISIISRPDTADACMEGTRLLCPNAAILYDTVDLHFLRRQRELRITGTSYAPASIKEEELLAVRRADATLVVSETERKHLLEEVPEAEVYVVSTIHETIRCTVPFKDRDGLLFIGGFNHPPNADALKWFIDDVLPLIHAELPKVRLHVVGSNPPEELLEYASERVLFEGFVRDLSEHLAHRRVSVAPLRFGAGVKGKVNQAMAHGLPCVATSVAAEGVESISGEDILVADGAERFASEVIRIYRSNNLWSKISKGSQSNVERFFSFEVAEARLAEAINSMND